MQDDASAGTALAPAPSRVLGSDPHDFAGLYLRHRSSFTAHARRYLRDPRDADEVVQEAFLRLFLAMPELETELQALAYCRRTITNLCIDRYRADARRPRLVALEGAPLDELAEDDPGDPVVRAEDAALVREALSKLPELHRAALVMREIEEKPLPVIADELDVAEDSVKHLLFRARRTLRKLLAGTSVAPGVDAERTRGLRPVARGASGGAAGLLLLALLGLGSGPDLRSVPVVGVDLPDVLGVTAVADAVRDVVGIIVPGERADDLAAGDLRSNPVSRSEALPPLLVAGEPGAPTTGAAVATLTAATRPAPRSSRRAPSSPWSTGSPSSPSSRSRPMHCSQPDRPRATPGVSTGRGPLPYVPTPVGSLLPVGRDLPVGPVLPVVACPAGPAAPTVRHGRRGPRTPSQAADKVAQKAADRAADVVKAADRAVDRAVDKAADKAEKAADKAEKTADKAADKAADRRGREGGSGRRRAGQGR